MFYREGHRRLFRAMLALTERRVVIDHITLRDELLRRGELEPAGGLEYLAELVDAVPTAANLEFHAKIVRDKAILRRLIEAATSIVTEAYDGHSTAHDLLDVAESRIFTDLPAARATTASRASRRCCGRRWSASKRSSGAAKRLPECRAAS